VEGEKLGWEEKWLSPDVLQSLAAAGVLRQVRDQ